MTDAFVRALSKVVVAQLCEDVKFHAVQRSALDTLSDILVRYVREIGEAAHSYAEHAGRTESNFHDILLAFNDLQISLTDIAGYMGAIDEVPFPRPIPAFPVVKKRRRLPSFAQKGETVPKDGIPSWLPAFPDKHTYFATPVYPERRSTPQENKVEQDKDRRRAEKALVSLHEKMTRVTSLGNGQAGARLSEWPEEPLPAFGSFTARSPPRQTPQTRGTNSLSVVPFHSSGSNAGQSPFLAPGQNPALPGSQAGLSNPYLAPPRSVATVELAQLGFSLESLGEEPGLADKAEPPFCPDGSTPTVLDVFSEVIKAGKEAKLREERGEDGEVDGGMRPATEAVWSGWSAADVRSSDAAPMPGFRSPGLSFDWGHKLRRKALQARDSYSIPGAEQNKASGSAGGKGGEKRKDEETDERRKRAEMILDRAESLEREEESGRGGHSFE
eukprot:TRINITY_DN9711_c0_g1_i1.p1 TRINITY_DN9711_c0_g1~~TRINITY_DN9711_c0_g1_i1.p1  ORF type:complete len:443 (+),score=70.57 TRINITY_DN9711_c0_g1_i1:106-1434(+)